MEKAADTQKQCKFSKYKVSSDKLNTLFTHTQTFTRERQATFRLVGTNVPTQSQPQRTCLELVKVHGANIFLV